MKSSDLILPGHGKVLASVKPSDTYVKVVLLQPVQFKPTEGVREAGEPIICNKALADQLASAGLAAIVYEEIDPKATVFRMHPLRS